jgi:hypothetical protein
MRSVFLLLFFTGSLFANGPYISPGVTTYQQKRWVGSDHLLKLQTPIRVAVKVSAQEDVPVVADQEIVQTVLETLQGEEIAVTTDFGEGTFKPFLHFLILALKVSEVVTFSIDERLFEDVQSDRARLGEEMTFQAVTWNYQSLHIAPEADYKRDLLLAVKEAASTFATRLKRFKLEEEQKI